MMRWLKCGLLGALLAVLAPLESAGAETRALVIANDYRGVGDLRVILHNTLPDASRIANALRRVHVDDVEVLSNPSVEDLVRAEQRLVSRLNSSDLALIYYAGHAIQVDGRNWIVSTDAAHLIEIDSLLSQIAARTNTVFFIDACRNNPFRSDAPSASQTVEARSLEPGSRGLQIIDRDALAGAASGLAQINDIRGRNALVVFSTEPGNIARDGERGVGSPFAIALSSELVRRQSLDQMVRHVTERVARATGGLQQPWRQGDLSEDVYIAGRPRFPPP